MTATNPSVTEIQMEPYTIKIVHADPPYADVKLSYPITAVVSSESTLPQLLYRFLRKKRSILTTPEIEEVVRTILSQLECDMMMRLTKHLGSSARSMCPVDLDACFAHERLSHDWKETPELFPCSDPSEILCTNKLVFEQIEALVECEELWFFARVPGESPSEIYVDAGLGAMTAGNLWESYLVLQNVSSFLASTHQPTGLTTLQDLVLRRACESFQSHYENTYEVMANPTKQKDQPKDPFDVFEPFFAQTAKEKTEPPAKAAPSAAPKSVVSTPKQSKHKFCYGVSGGGLTASTR